MTLAPACTFLEEDCEDVVECNARVTIDGTSFVVTKRGTAIFHARNSLGYLQILKVQNCLISPKFPHRFLSLQAFTKKGHTVKASGDLLKFRTRERDFCIQHAILYSTQ